ncbi:MAG: hypothetical protein Rhims3KO_16760 [Hyphomicrobiales bacterium]
MADFGYFICVEVVMLLQQPVLPPDLAGEYLLPAFVQDSPNSVHSGLTFLTWLGMDSADYLTWRASLRACLFVETLSSAQMS